MSLASFDGIEETLTWAGVGGGNAMLLRHDEHARETQTILRLQPGLVGYRLPLLHATIVPVFLGDVLVLTTDGIRNDFAQAFTFDDGAAKIAQFILSNFKRGTDNDLVLVARYRGAKHT